MSQPINEHPTYSLAARNIALRQERDELRAQYKALAAEVCEWVGYQTLEGEIPLEAQWPEIAKALKEGRDATGDLPAVWGVGVVSARPITELRKGDKFVITPEKRPFLDFIEVKRVAGDGSWADMTIQNWASMTRGRLRYPFWDRPRRVERRDWTVADVEASRPSEEEWAAFLGTVTS